MKDKVLLQKLSYENGTEHINLHFSGTVMNFLSFGWSDWDSVAMTESQ